MCCSSMKICAIILQNRVVQMEEKIINSPLEYAFPLIINNISIRNIEKILTEAIVLVNGIQSFAIHQELMLDVFIISIDRYLTKSKN